MVSSVNFALVDFRDRQVWAEQYKIVPAILAYLNAFGSLNSKGWVFLGPEGWQAVSARMAAGQAFDDLLDPIGYRAFTEYLQLLEHPCDEIAAGTLTELKQPLPIHVQTRLVADLVQHLQADFNDVRQRWGSTYQTSDAYSECLGRRMNSRHFVTNHLDTEAAYLFDKLVQRIEEPVNESL